MANIFCEKCATEITLTTRRCPVCGNKITPPKVKAEERPEVVDNRFEVRNDYVDLHDARQTPKEKRFEVKEPVVFTDKTTDASTRFVSQLPKELTDFLKKYDLYSDQAIFFLALSFFVPWIGIILILAARSDAKISKNAAKYGTIGGVILWVILSVF